jgi:type III secretory pathway component EscU
MEIKLYDWYERMIHIKEFRITSFEVKQKAKEFCKNPDFKASKGWLEKYKNKFPMHLLRRKRNIK